MPSPAVTESVCGPWIILNLFHKSGSDGIGHRRVRHQVRQPRPLDIGLVNALQEDRNKAQQQLVESQRTEQDARQQLAELSKKLSDKDAQHAKALQAAEADSSQADKKLQEAQERHAAQMAELAASHASALEEQKSSLEQQFEVCRDLSATHDDSAMQRHALYSGALLLSCLAQGWRRCQASKCAAFV